MLGKETKKYVVNGISNSSLSWFEVSPRYFKDNWDGIIERPDKSYLDVGTKTHYFLLQPEEFNKLYTYLEYTTPRGEKQKQFCEEYLNLKAKGKKKDDDAAILAYEKTYVVSKKSKEKITEEALSLQKELSKYLQYLEASEQYKEVINYSTLYYLESAKKAVQSHKLAKELLLTEQPDFIENDDLIIRNEYNILWKHPFIKIKNENALCSSTIDRMIIDHKNKKVTLVDLKTTYKLSKFHEESFLNYKYYRQLAYYWMAIYYMFKTEFPDKDLNEYAKETYIVALQTNNSYTSDLPIECKVFKIGEDMLSRGEEEFTDLLTQLAWHFENDLWDHTKEYYEGDGSIKI